MGKAKKTRKFALMKLRLRKSDARLGGREEKEGEEKEEARVPVPSSLFFNYNMELGPPYHVIVDTNFINFTLKNRLEMVSGMMDCLCAKVTPCVTDCVIGELEKLGIQFRMALRVAKDPRFRRLPCAHSGTYADDCIVKKVTAYRCFIVGTCDRDLKRRLRKIPGVPIMYIKNHQYTIERMPDALGAPL